MFEHYLFLIATDYFPFAEKLAEPWDWFLAKGPITQVALLAFGGLALYLAVRIFFKTVESILNIFGE